MYCKETPEILGWSPSSSIQKLKKPTFSWVRTHGTFLRKQRCTLNTAKSVVVNM